jgi:hypothetical protein
MLHVNQLIGFGAGGPSGPVVITQTAAPAGAATSGNVATYSSQSIGAASPDRIVCLLVGCERISASINSATIDSGGGPVAMTAGSLGNEGIMYARAFYASVPSGTTATFTVTFATNDPLASENRVSVYSVTGANATPATSGADASSDMDASDPLTTGSITIPTGGGFLAVAAGLTDTDAKTWSNATEDIDVDAGLFRYTTAFTTTPGTVTITCQGTSNGEDGAMSWIIFNSL